MDHYFLVLLQYLQYYPPPKAPVNELSHKSNERLMAGTITWETKREGQNMHNLNPKPKKKGES
jgi:hypothetical protein